MLAFFSKLSNRNQAFVFAILCILAWSLIPVVSKAVATDLLPLQFLFWSNVLSSVVIYLLTKKFPVDNFKKQIKENIVITIIPSFLGCFLYYVILYYAYANINGISVLVVQYTWPALVVLLSPIVLKEKLTFQGIISTILGFLAVLVVVTKGNFTVMQWENIHTLLIVLGGAFAFAMYSLLSKKIQGNPLVVVLLFFLWASLFSFVILLVFGNFSFPSSLRSWLSVIINGAIINGISYFWWLKALQLEKANIIAPLVFISPVLATIFLIVFYQEEFFISYFIGILLCIVSGLIATYSKKY
ncbi:EamA-like transporter family [Candidatus Hepatincola sp. Av]